MTPLLTGKRVQAINSFEMAMKAARKEARNRGERAPTEGSVDFALAMGGGSFRGCKNLAQ